MSPYPSSNFPEPQEPEEDATLVINLSDGQQAYLREPHSPYTKFSDEATSATLLDDNWFVSGPVDADQTTIAEASMHFGPGIPAWHRPSPRRQLREQKRARRRRRRPYILGTLVALCIGLTMVWQQHNRPLQVTKVTLSSHKKAKCGQAIVVVGNIHTNGASGEIEYRWLRSDGSRTHVERQKIASGQQEIQVRLNWSFIGAGKYTARATLQISEPNARAASTSLTYRCRT